MPSDTIPSSSRRASDLARLVADELAPDEIVRWQGTPCRRAELLHPGNWLFAFVWIAGSIGWLILAQALSGGPVTLPGLLRLEPDAVLPAIGWAACVIGLLLLVPPVRAMLRAGRLIYAITDRRLLRIEDTRRPRTLSIPLARIDSVGDGGAAGRYGTIRVSATTIQDGCPVGSGAFVLRGVSGAELARALLLDGGE